MSAETVAPSINPDAKRLRSRPFGIAVLAGLFILRAVLLAGALTAPTLADLGLIGRIFQLPLQIATAVRENPIAVTIVVVLIASLAAAAILLRRGRRSGWRIGVLTTGFFLLIDLVQASRGDMHTLWMALDVAVVFYLNQRDVRDYFAIGGERQPA